MDKETLIKIIQSIDMKEIKEVKISYVYDIGYGPYKNDKIETIEIKK